jgi:hypothetical protein
VGRAAVRDTDGRVAGRESKWGAVDIQGLEVPGPKDIEHLKNDLLPGELQRSYEDTYGHPIQA